MPSAPQKITADQFFNQVSDYYSKQQPDDISTTLRKNPFQLEKDARKSYQLNRIISIVAAVVIPILAIAGLAATAILAPMGLPFAAIGVGFSMLATYQIFKSFMDKADQAKKEMDSHTVNRKAYEALYNLSDADYEKKLRDEIFQDAIPHKKDPNFNLKTLIPLVVEIEQLKNSPALKQIQQKHAELKKNLYDRLGKSKKEDDETNDWDAISIGYKYQKRALKVEQLSNSMNIAYNCHLMKHCIEGNSLAKNDGKVLSAHYDAFMTSVKGLYLAIATFGDENAKLKNLLKMPPLQLIETLMEAPTPKEQRNPNRNLNREDLVAG